MKKRIQILLLASAMLLSGCGNTNENETQATEEATESASIELFSDRDYEIGYDENEAVFIQLDGDSANCDSQTVQIEDGVITITDEGTYVLSGNLEDGMIIVDSEKTDKTQLVLDNVTINSEASAPIYVRQSDKVFITTTADSENVLSNGGTFTAIDENNIDSVIYSKEDLTLNGAGTLVITSPAGHGIVSKDSLKLTSGIYDINAASHGLAGKDDVCIANGEYAIVSGKDGIHAENTDDTEVGFVHILDGKYNISAEGDGISASSYAQVEDGSFDITSGGGSENGEKASSESYGDFMGGGRHPGGKMEMPNTIEESKDSTSMKGIKSAGDLSIQGGSFTINSADDSIHSDTSVTVSGGSFEIESGDDAFHAEETLAINDGNISITKSYEGLEGLHIVVSGGEISLVASDDGLNAAGGTDASGMEGGRDGQFGKGQPSSSNGSITISGGKLNITASGDGIDANGTVDITGGYTVVCGPTQGDTATLDYDTSAVISGGTFIGTGASGMAQTFSESEQGVVAVNVGSQSAGTEIHLTDNDGNTVIEYAPDMSFEVVILSSPDIVTGENYTITVGSASGEFAAN